MTPSRVAVAPIVAGAILLMAAGGADAQRTRRPPAGAPPVAGRVPVRAHPVHPLPFPSVRGHVFIGGYFYDPFYGPYPWWPLGAYPYWYAPVFDLQADVHLKILPKEVRHAAVYVDGFYAGVVDDFDGAFQSLPLTPGGHRLVVYQEGYRTIAHNIYLARGSSFTVRETMLRLPAGERSEPPDIAPDLPAPPEGSYRRPVTPARPDGPRPTTVVTAAGFGALDIFVQPDGAAVVIDGGRWDGNDDGHFLLHLAVGKHRIEVTHPGYQTFATEIDVRAGDPLPLNIVLPRSST